MKFIKRSSQASFTYVLSFQFIPRYYKKQFALNIRRDVCPWVLKNMVSLITPVTTLDWKEFPSRILIIIVKYLFFESPALFLRSPYYATSALNFKCDKQSMSAGGRWLMTSSDRAFKPALFSEKRYFHVNSLCVLQRWDKSPAHNSGKVETTRSREGPWLDPSGVRGEKVWEAFLVCSTGARSVTLHYVSSKKMNQPRASHIDTRATAYCRQILFIKTDIFQRQKTGAIKSVCQPLKSGFCKTNLIVHAISDWNYYSQQKSPRNIQLKIKWNVIHRENDPCRHTNLFGFLKPYRIHLSKMHK